MIPNIEVTFREIPTKEEPYLHVYNYNDNTIDYFKSKKIKKYEKSIGVWKPKINSVIKK